MCVCSYARFTDIGMSLTRLKYVTEREESWQTNLNGEILKYSDALCVTRSVCNPL